jgi:hypothetical protein
MNDRELRALISSDEIRKGTYLHIDGNMFNNVEGNIWAYYKSCIYDPNDIWTPVQVSVSANFGEMGGWEEAVCYATDILDYLNIEKKVPDIYNNDNWEDNISGLHNHTSIFKNYAVPPRPPVPPAPPPTRLVRDGKRIKSKRGDDLADMLEEAWNFNSHGTY